MHIYVQMESENLSDMVAKAIAGLNQTRLAPGVIQAIAPDQDITQLAQKGDVVVYGKSQQMKETVESLHNKGVKVALAPLSNSKNYLHKLEMETKADLVQPITAQGSMLPLINKIDNEWAKGK